MTLDRLLDVLNVVSLNSLALLTCLVVTVLTYVFWYCREQKSSSSQAHVVPPQRPGFHCARCHTKIVDAGDIIVEPFPPCSARGKLWFSNTLDMLDLEDVSTYGNATNRVLIEAENPNLTEDELDQVETKNYIVRVRYTKRVLSQLCLEGRDGIAAAANHENTWFPPFAWQIAYCAECTRPYSCEGVVDSRSWPGFGHLGWVFTTADDHSQQEPFIALKLTYGGIGPALLETGMLTSEGGNT